MVVVACYYVVDLVAFQTACFAKVMEMVGLRVIRQNFALVGGHPENAVGSGCEGDKIGALPVAGYVAVSTYLQQPAIILYTPDTAVGQLQHMSDIAAAGIGNRQLLAGCVIAIESNVCCNP